ncbi:hypothetical protein SETIT_5G325000v2 [Setaria italica]|uniref:Uncharacterized protein n=1 Tax=Setaria italica TaxID=4555 RepID=A0A368RB93_SETIT|nr:hypothetical protein SETIT_5G325000v2 [Setaria italica]
MPDPRAREDTTQRSSPSVPAARHLFASPPRCRWPLPILASASYRVLHSSRCWPRCHAVLFYHKRAGVGFAYGKDEADRWTRPGGRPAGCWMPGSVWWHGGTRNAFRLILLRQEETPKRLPASLTVGSRAAPSLPHVRHPPYPFGVREGRGAISGSSLLDRVLGALTADLPDPPSQRSQGPPAPRLRGQDHAIPGRAPRVMSPAWASPVDGYMALGLRDRAAAPRDPHPPPPNQQKPLPYLTSPDARAPPLHGEAAQLLMPRGRRAEALADPPTPQSAGAAPRILPARFGPRPVSCCRGEVLAFWVRPPYSSSDSVDCPSADPPRRRSGGRVTTAGKAVKERG